VRLPGPDSNQRPIG